MFRLAVIVTNLPAMPLPVQGAAAGSRAAPAPVRRRTGRTIAVVGVGSGAAHHRRTAGHRHRRPVVDDNRAVLPSRSIGIGDDIGDRYREARRTGGIYARSVDRSVWGAGRHRRIHLKLDVHHEPDIDRCGKIDQEQGAVDCKFDSRYAGVFRAEAILSRSSPSAVTTGSIARCRAYVERARAEAHKQIARGDDASGYVVSRRTEVERCAAASVYVAIEIIGN